MKDKLLASVAHRCLEPLSIGLGLGLGLGLGAGASGTPSDLANGEMDFSETTESGLIVLLEDI